MNEIYFGDNPIIPENQLYQQAIKILRVTTDDNDEIMEVLGNILGIIEAQIEELEFEEK